ncbi:hypothetical protein F5141DRAFT_1213644 [Pisolithus sp. B1]|nr:hypothetical protein F5141DRAFT_1213644 [Pisolithus sp. B1]
MSSINISPMPMPLTNSNGILPHDISAAAAPPTFDVSMFKSYLLSLLPPILGASSEELLSLFDDECEERVTRFTADGGGMIYIIKIKEIQKLELSLLHLQQNVEIPETHLIIHPIIQWAAEQAQAANVQLNISFIPA